MVVVSTPGSSVGRQFDQSALVVSHHSLADLAKDEEKDETADDQGCHLPPGLENFFPPSLMFEGEIG